MNRWRSVLLGVGLLAVVGCTPREAPAEVPSVETAVEAEGSPVETAVSAVMSATPEAMAAVVTPSLVEKVVLPAGLVSGLNRFSLKLYLDVAKGKPGNLAVSPLGSFLLLEMLYEGSTGPTQAEIARSTGFSETSLAEAGLMVKGLQALPSLSLAQKIYLDTRAKLVEDYLSKVGPLLAEPVQTVSFERDPAGAVRIINDWVELNTKGLIKDFLRPLDPDTVAVLVSVLHFQGTWKHEFDANLTKPGEFQPAEGAPRKVAMMRLERRDLSTFSVPLGRGLVLPYSDDTEMVLLLPDAGKTPDEVMAKWDPFQPLPAPSRKPLVVELPRFQFEVPTFRLTDNWRAVGLDVTVNGPDLSPMLKLEPPAALVLEIFHKTFVKVDEKGTQAAAATAVAVITRSSARTAPPEVMRFDRPFAFALRHSTSGAIFMLGRVDRPEEVP